MAVPGTGWVQVGGNALDIAVGADGTVYHVGSEGEGKVYMWDGGGGWIDLNYRLNRPRISAGPDGALWHFGLYGGVFKRSKSGEITDATPGSRDSKHERDIGVGSDGAVWLTHHGSAEGGRRNPLLLIVYCRR